MGTPKKKLPSLRIRNYHHFEEETTITLNIASFACVHATLRHLHVHNYRLRIAALRIMCVCDMRVLLQLQRQRAHKYISIMYTYIHTCIYRWHKDAEMHTNSTSRTTSYAFKLRTTTLVCLPEHMRYTSKHTRDAAHNQSSSHNMIICVNTYDTHQSICEMLLTINLHHHDASLRSTSLVS